MLVVLLPDGDLVAAANYWLFRVPRPGLLVPMTTGLGTGRHAKVNRRRFTCPLSGDRDDGPLSLLLRQRCPHPRHIAAEVPGEYGVANNRNQRELPACRKNRHGSLPDRGKGFTSAALADP